MLKVLPVGYWQVNALITLFVATVSVYLVVQIVSSSELMDLPVSPGSFVDIDLPVSSSPGSFVDISMSTKVSMSTISFP